MEFNMMTWLNWKPDPCDLWRSISIPVVNSFTCLTAVDAVLLVSCKSQIIKLFPACNNTNILSRVGVIIDGVLDWMLDLLTTCTHNSELHVITAAWLISTFHKSPQHTLFFPACCVFTSRPLVTLLTAEILQIPRSSPLWKAAPFQLIAFSQNWLGCPNCLPYNSSARPDQIAPFVLLSFVAVTCLRSRFISAAVYSCLLRNCCLSTDVIPLSLSRPLPRNEYCFRAVRWQRLFFWLHSSCR
jgi:hypothetical protein